MALHQKKDVIITTTRKRKSIDLADCDSDTESTDSSQDATSSPPSSPPKTRLRQAKSTTNKSTINKSTSTKNSTSKITKSKAQISTDAEDVSSIDSTPNKDMYKDIFDMVTSIKDIKKELADIRQAIPTQNTTPLSPRQVPTKAPVAYSPNGNPPCNHCVVPNTSSAPHYSYEPPQSHAYTPPHSHGYAPPQSHSYTPPHSHNYEPHSHGYESQYPYGNQRPTTYNSQPYSQSPNQLHTQVYVDSNILNDEIYHHLEQAKYHRDLADKLLYKKAK